MRCFVAVDVSERAREQVGRLLGALRPSVPGVRWVRPDRMHLTLVFLGEVDDRFVDRARQALEGATSGAAPFRARLGGLGAFPSPGRARVVWVGMKEGRDALCGLQQRVESALEGAGYRPERRPFSPHLTLGRLRTPGDVAPACAVDFTSDGFNIDRVVMYRSVLAPEGPEYTRLAEFPLAAAGSA